MERAFSVDDNWKSYPPLTGPASVVKKSEGAESIWL